MTATALQLARAHDCAEVQSLGVNVRVLDASYYDKVFAADPEIAACLTPTPPTTPRDAPPAPVIRPTGSPKSTELATGLAIGATAAAIPLFAFRSSTIDGLAVAAILVGPSAGHFYAHEWSWWLPLRVAGAGLLAGGGLEIAEIKAGNSPSASGPRALTLLVPGALLLLTGIGGDFATSPRAVHDYNRAHGWEPPMTIAPIAVPGGAGLGLVGGF